MPIRESEQLRQLVNDRYHGLITEESYRQQRANLLDNIGKEQPADLDVTARRPRVRQAPSTPEPAAPAPAPPKESSSGGARWLIPAIAVVAAAVIGIVGMTFLGGSETPVESTNVDEGTADVELGSPLIAGFLSRNQWTSDSVNNFLIAWEALDDGQREDVFDTREYRRLTTQLHRRIREQLALGSGDGNRQFEVLTEFAAAIGAPYRVSTFDEGGETESNGDVQPDMPVESVAVTEDDPVEIQPDPVVPEDPEPAPVETPVADTASEAPTPAPSETVEAPATETNQEPPNAEDPCTADKAMTRRPYCQDVLADGSEGPMLVILPGGSFSMGSDGFDTESPRHGVDIGYAFAMSAYEVTAAEFEKYCSETGKPCDAQPWREDSPAVSVSWNDAVGYVEWLSEATGFSYRLPTEAEWEFAARAGTDTPYFFGEEITPSWAHSSVNGETNEPMAVSDRGVNRNPFRLYHMSGNVREWVQDSWTEDYRNAPGDGSAVIAAGDSRKVVRGGSYRDAASSLRSAAREPLASNHKDVLTGIRIVREIIR